MWTGGPGNVISRTEIRKTSDGLRLDGGTTVVDSWIHDLVINQIGGVHSDGSQTTAGSSPIVFQHDSIMGGTNDAVFDETSGSSLTVTGCLFTADQTGGNAGVITWKNVSPGSSNTWQGDLIDANAITPNDPTGAHSDLRSLLLDPIVSLGGPQAADISYHNAQSANEVSCPSDFGQAPAPYIAFDSTTVVKLKCQAG